MATPVVEAEGSLEEPMEQPLITDLSLAGKQLVFLPRDIFRISSLHFLDLSNNALAHLPKEIEMLPNL